MTRRLRIAAILLAALALSCIPALLATGDDGPPATPGADVGRGAYLGGFGLPGELLGSGAFVLRVPAGRRYHVVSWRFREVDPPATAVAYGARPWRDADVSACRGRLTAFDGDARTALRDGVRYPCAMTAAAGRLVTGEAPLELIGVYWNAPREGVVTHVAEPEVLLRDDLGRLSRVTGDGGQDTCAVGVRACARWSAAEAESSDGDSDPPTRAEVRAEEEKPRWVCHRQARGPLFATPENRPPRPAGVERGTDTDGSRCAAPPLDGAPPAP
ncbi:hypothetical protein AB0L40_22745 [Patulibacter sp. NPDC049589]|uniref:hypothetical protein n=1 Tax=Patulibacter sp. NPDC049589 TaxID=3154731 RepID=UPI0034190B19